MASDDSSDGTLAQLEDSSGPSHDDSLANVRPGPINDVPREIRDLVLSFLSPKDATALSHTNKGFFAEKPSHAALSVRLTNNRMSELKEEKKTFPLDGDGASSFSAVKTVIIDLWCPGKIADAKSALDAFNDVMNTHARRWRSVRGVVITYDTDRAILQSQGISSRALSPAEKVDLVSAESRVLDFLASLPSLQRLAFDRLDPLIDSRGMDDPLFGPRFLDRLHALKEIDIRYPSNVLAGPITRMDRLTRTVDESVGLGPLDVRMIWTPYGQQSSAAFEVLCEIVKSANEILSKPCTRTVTIFDADPWLRAAIETLGVQGSQSQEDGQSVIPDCAEQLIRGKQPATLYHETKDLSVSRPDDVHFAEQTKHGCESSSDSYASTLLSKDNSFDIWWTDYQRRYRTLLKNRLA